jgi:hypothetical protein
MGLWDKGSFMGEKSTLFTLFFFGLVNKCLILYSMLIVFFFI